MTEPGLASLTTERTTAATDLLLALVVGAGILRLRRGVPPGWRRGIWTTALGAFGVSALLGAVAHGLALDDRLRDALWQPLYLLLGLAVALFVVGAVGDWRGERAAGAMQAGDSVMVRIGWDFDHNGLYHLVQIVGVLLLVRGLTLTLR